MIKFKTDASGVWVSGADKAFDSTELKVYKKSERATVKFLLNPYTPDKVKELRDSHKKVVDTENLSIQDILSNSSSGIDSDALHADAIDYVVADWSGILDESGNPLPCTRDNKLSLANKGYPLLAGAWIEIARWLIAKHEQYEGERKAVEEKN